MGGTFAAAKSGLGILTIHKTGEINLSLGDLINLSRSLCEMSRREREEVTMRWKNRQRQG